MLGAGGGGRLVRWDTEAVTAPSYAQQARTDDYGPCSGVSRMASIEEISSSAGGGGPQGRRGTRSLNTQIAHAMKAESPSALRAPPPAGEEIFLMPLKTPIGRVGTRIVDLDRPDLSCRPWNTSHGRLRRLEAKVEWLAPA